MTLGTSSSRRTQRIARHQRRSSQRTALNLTSMMDIFTILVFFLMANSSNIEVLPSPKAMQLPESIAQQHARETVVIMVTEQDILVRDRRVMGLVEAERADTALLPALGEELRRIPLREPAPDADPAADRPNRGEVTIMADRDIPFALLKKVMATCSDAQFSRISLAVVRKSAESA